MNITEWAVLSGIFVSVLIMVSVTVTFIIKQIRARQRQQNTEDIAEILAINDYFSIDQEQYNHYFKLANNAKPDDMAMRLLRCGFLSVRANQYLQLMRTSLMLIAAISVAGLMLNSERDFAISSIALTSLMAAALAFLLVGISLDKLEKRAKINSRKLLPDLLDLLIVCLDAGISMEAAFERVSREFAVSNANFSFHLVILSLEVRAGRPLSLAMINLAQRLQVEEFRALAILFQQSERLGASVNQTLRTYSAEMREKRLLLAEEKANALPVKMLFPMAVLIFPVNLFIVLVPVMLNLMVMFKDF